MEVYVTVSKIISAFQKSADALHGIQARKEKKKRKKEKDLEELVEGRLLHRSLLEGRDQCQRIVSDRHQQYGMAFDVGDAPANSALKDVVISVQEDILQPLQMSLVNEASVVRFGQLLELSITNRQSAIRVVDELCLRLASGAGQSGDVYFEDSYDAQPSPYVPPVSSNTATIHPQMYRTRSNESEELLPMATAASAYQTAQYPQPLSFQRTQSNRRPTNMPPNRHMSQISHGSLYSDWSGQRVRSPEIDAGIRRRMLREEEEDDEDYAKASIDARGRRRSDVSSIHDSAIGSMPTSNHNPSITGSSAAVPQPAKNIPIGEQVAFERAQKFHPPSTSDRTTSITSTNFDLGERVPVPDGMSTRTDSISSSTPRSPMPSQAALEKDDGLSPDTSDASSFSSHTRAVSNAASARTETAEDRVRAIHAPEVVTKEFESMLLQPGRPSLHSRQQSTPSDIHPALLEPFQMPTLPPAIAIPQPWLPLPRPARHNNYHGFCKGAWQIRKNIREGLSIRMIPNANGVEVPHWKCKMCEYRSKGVSLQSANVLPDEVFFHARTNIRYRWLFLAKSHTYTLTAHTTPAGYTYGCIFCAAQGRTTGTYDKLDALMAHIVSKHKTAMLTPETRESCKAVVGGVADKREEWDINLPETRKVGAMGALGEFTVAAVTGLSKYG